MPRTSNQIQLRDETVVFNGREYTNHSLPFWNGFIPLNSFTTILGVPNAGKTVLATCLIDKLMERNAWLVTVSGSEKYNGTYGAMGSALTTFTDFTPEFFKYIAKRQELAHVMMVHGINPRITLVIDDCGAKRKGIRSEDVNELAALRRHMNMDVIFIFQHAKSATPEVRELTDTWFQFYPSDPKTEQTQMEIIATGNIPPDIYRELLEFIRNPEEHKCLVFMKQYHNKDLKTLIGSMINIFKADEKYAKNFKKDYSNPALREWTRIFESQGSKKAAKIRAYAMAGGKLNQ
jgi:hypothetical protein